MYHRTRWTPEKIRQRLELIAPLVYIKQKSISPFFYRGLDDALVTPPVGLEVDNLKPYQIVALRVKFK